MATRPVLYERAVQAKKTIAVPVWDVTASCCFQITDFNTFFTSNIDAKHIGRTEFARDHCSARVKEGHAVSFKFLHDKALTAEEPCAESALKFDTDRDPFCSAEKGIFPANDFSVEQVEVCGNNFPGKGAAKVTWRFP